MFNRMTYRLLKNQFCDYVLIDKLWNCHQLTISRHKNMPRGFYKNWTIITSDAGYFVTKLLSIFMNIGMMNFHYEIRI